jgi:putative transposase
MLDALMLAVWSMNTKGSVIIHSDQNSQFGSDEFNRLSTSMSRLGNCLDSIRAIVIRCRSR